jgi:c-di-GMP-binding flagellar brake protein YcgR
MAVSFHVNNRRISFATTVIKLDDAYQFNATMKVPAFLVAPAKEIKAVQRRSAYRVQVPQDSDLIVRVLKITEHAHVNDRPPPSQQVNLTVHDISIGGLGVLVEQTDAEHKLISGQRLRVELTYNEAEIVLDARLRCGPDSDKKAMHAGVVFKKLESDVEGRQKLASITKIVGELSRAEVRRMRRSA